MLKIAAITLILSTTAVHAQGVASFSQVRIVPGYMTETGQYLAGVEIDMEPGWKTYWRQPGEGGIPPIFDWSGSSNVISAQVEWPIPEVFETYGLRSIGYKTRVVFPVLFEVIDRDADTALNLSLSYGLCSDICIPANSEASVDVTIDQPQNMPLLQQARQNTTVDATGVSADCAIVPAADAWRLDTVISAEALSPDMVAVFETNDPNLWIGTPDAVEQGAGLLFSAPMDWFGAGAFALSRDDVRITLIRSGISAVELTGC